MIKHFCADPHFSRRTEEGRGILNRPFKTANEMSLTLLDSINSCVDKNDILYILGDFAFSWSETAYWRQLINCKNIFITRGNHDIPLSRLKEIFGTDFAENILETSIYDLELKLCHYPFMYWDNSHHNSACLHGHLHDQRTATYMAAFPGIRCLDVAFESADKLLGKFRPFTEEEIYEIIMMRKGHDPFQFYVDIQGQYKKNH